MDLFIFEVFWKLSDHRAAVARRVSEHLNPYWTAILSGIVETASEKLPMESYQLMIGQKHYINIINFPSPSTFWFTTLKDKLNVIHLEQTMKTFYEQHRAQHYRVNPLMLKCGLLIAVRGVTGTWHRAQIIAIYKNFEVSVIHVDSGLTAHVSDMNDIRALMRCYSQQPAYAHRGMITANCSVATEFCYDSFNAQRGNIVINAQFESKICLFDLFMLNLEHPIRHSIHEIIDMLPPVAEQGQEIYK